jgi:hypothetical protein
LRIAGEEGYALLSIQHCTLPFSGIWDSLGRAPARGIITRTTAPASGFQADLWSLRPASFVSKAKWGTRAVVLGSFIYGAGLP